MAKTLPRIKKVTIDVVEGEEVRPVLVTVAKAPLGRWQQMLDSLQVLFNLVPAVLEQRGVEDKEQFINDLTPQDLLGLLPDMLKLETEEIIKLLALGTGLEAEYLKDNVGIDEVLDLLEAIIEVNGLVKAVKKGKKLVMAVQGLAGR